MTRDDTVHQYVAGAKELGRMVKDPLPEALLSGPEPAAPRNTEKGKQHSPHVEVLDDDDRMWEDGNRRGEAVEDRDRTHSPHSDEESPRITKKRRAPMQTAGGLGVQVGWDDDEEEETVDSTERERERERERGRERERDRNHPTYPNKNRRRRKKWTDEEVERLKDGVKRWGKGDWTNVKRDFFASSERTTVDLKDKWRGLENKGLV